GNFQQGQATSHIAIGRTGDLHQCLVGDLQRLPAQPALRVVQRATQGERNIVRRHRVHHVHPAPRQQRRIELERRVLGGGANKQDRAALDMWQERILLGLVEPVHLLHEQHRAAAFGEALCGFRQYLAHFRQPGQHRRYRPKLGVGVLRQQQRERGFAATRRPPQNHRMRLAGLHGAAQCRLGCQQPALADHLVERRRPHPFGQRSQSAGVNAQQVRRASGTIGSGSAGYGQGNGGQPSPMTSTPSGGVYLNVSAANRGLRCHWLNSIRVLWPTASSTSMRISLAPANPRRAERKLASSSFFGVRLSQSRPSLWPVSLTTKRWSSVAGSNKAASGLFCSSAPCARTVTCSRSGSKIHTLLPSATINCGYGLTYSQRNNRGTDSCTWPVAVSFRRLPAS